MRAVTKGECAVPSCVLPRQVLISYKHRWGPGKKYASVVTEGVCVQHSMPANWPDSWGKYLQHKDISE